MKKKTKIILSILSFILILGGVSGYIYLHTYYDAFPAASLIKMQDNVVETRDVIEIKNTKTTKGFIFYPGGKVDADAYLPLLSQLSEEGVNVFLVEMPFHLAVFDKNAAQQIMNQHPEITEWYIGGHSLGGAMASSFYAENPGKIEGLILLGAYIYGDVEPSRALTIYGSEDRVLNRAKITYKTNVVEIMGGNHAGFGEYGPQKGDGVATISSAAQQKETVQEIIQFMEK